MPIFRVLIVGGGGGGGGSSSAQYMTSAGGGGAGGFHFAENFEIPYGNTTVVVGRGGIRGSRGTGTTTVNGNQGADSSIGSVRAGGGGGGGGAGGFNIAGKAGTSGRSGNPAENGGSGGGGGSTNVSSSGSYPNGLGGPRAAGTYTGKANNGGAGSNNSASFGGGGGNPNYVGSSSGLPPIGRVLAGKTYSFGGGGSSNSTTVRFDPGSGGNGDWPSTPSRQSTDGRDGLVVIAYEGAPQHEGGTIVQEGGWTFHEFWTRGTYDFNVLAPVINSEVRATLPSLRSNGAVFVGEVPVAANVSALLPAIVGDIRGIPAGAGSVDASLPALRAAFVVDMLEPEQMPDTVVTIDNDLRYLTSEALVAVTTYPHFGYFDGASLSPMTMFINAGGAYETRIATMLPSMTSDGFVRFPIETNFTSALPNLIGDFEGFADNFRNADLAAALPSMVSDGKINFPIEVTFGTTLLPLSALADAFVGELPAQVNVATILPLMRGDGYVWVGYGARMSARLPALTSDILSVQIKDAVVGATLSAIRSDIEVFPNRYRDVEIGATLPHMRAAFEGGPDEGAIFAGVLQSLTADIDAWVDIWAYANSTLPALASDGEVYLHPGVLDLGILPAMRSNIEVWQDIWAELSVALPAMHSDIEVWQDVWGDLSVTLPAMHSDMEAWVEVWVDLNARLAGMRGTLDVNLNNPGRIASTLGSMRSDILVATDYEVAFEASLSRMRMSGLVGVEGFGDISARMGHMSADIDVYAHPGVLDLGTLPVLRADVLAIQLKDGRLGAIMPTMFGEFSGFPDGAAFVTATMPGPMTSEIWVGPPNQVDMNTRLPAMQAFFYGGWPTETFVESTLPGMTSFFLGGQPYDLTIETSLAAMTSFFLVEGLPADTNQMGPVDFDGGLETERFTISGAVIFGFGKTFP